ncbi:nuclear autoantigenic sperm protein-like isoform X4 [Scleropages formosus]|uniref:nuclear autoantigenic sperm protein-like isoform X4 n=1 Tax=Scleropages formosus TaxID=113540 RepID=UPI0008783E13|nr:nuclear autoantigenic sperm protein isoform X4 [Scleropages formosus]
MSSFLSLSERSCSAPQQKCLSLTLAEEKPCSSSAADSTGDVMEEARKLLGKGNKHLIMGDVVSAVNVFQEACAMLAEKYGDTADECGEAFFLCGKALLELARMENTVLGNALEGVPEEDSEEGDNMNNSKTESADNLDEDDDDDDDSDEGEGPGDSKESEEEVGNLQLAWEMLEVAKVIYKRKETKEDQLMAAQAYLKLGEVGAESGNYAQALEDFQECLALQLKYLPPHSRLLAETHYQLGVTFGYTNHYTQALQHFSSSIKVIESRMALLQEAIDKADGEDGAAEEKQEMEELMELLPDIREKVEDTKESQKTAAEASLAIQQTLGGASTSSGFPGNSEMSASVVSQIPVKPSDEASSKSASDISHLVRKKRKPEEENPVKESDAKKVKHEATVNGSGDSASNGNGVQEKMEQEETEKQSAPVESSS